ncbi:MAG TPA: glycosyltransferase family 2 protein [Chthonomonadaceae bacterium]|nr:glycosyltransferase family 2 protein [Chthonomonadaceae bacterium]
MRPDLTISLINHSNPDLLRDCLRSLYATTMDISFEVFVVDNATGGRGVGEMRAEFPQVRWLFNSERLGFSANHNQVLSQAQGRYACILNDDMLAQEGALDTLVRFMDAHPAVGMAGARLLDPDGSPQNCAFRFLTPLSELIGICFLPATCDGWKRLGVDAAQEADCPARVDWVLGACIVVRDRALQEIGLLDSDLSPIANTEEVDWCLRAWKAGWEVAYCPAATLIHYGGQSMPPPASGADRMRVEMLRTRIAYFRKHHGRAQALLVRAIYLATLPWNLFMLTQSRLRLRLPAAQYRSHLATLTQVALMSLRPAIRYRHE